MKLPAENRGIFPSAKLTGFILLLLAQVNLLSFSQAGKNNSGVQGNFSEELYLKTDRDLYIAGEKVWLKIYKLNGLTHTPVNLSKIAYLDLLDPDNNPVIELKIELDGFSGSGDLRLPDTLRTGNYLLRSYTSWMQNFSKDLFAYKSISVINPFAKLSDIKVNSSLQSADSVIFYPEGGHLVAGIESRIVLRSFNKNRDPVPMKGALIDENNDTLMHVQSGKNGYGWARLKLSDQRKIFLVPINKNYGYKKFQLPAVKDGGITLSAVSKNESSTNLVKIIRSPDFNSAGHNLCLVLNSAGLTDIKKKINIEKDHEINILRNDLPYGLSHLMIVDEHENILTDRWIFNDKNAIINYSIHLQKQVYSTREKIRIDISAIDDKGSPVESDFSLSVAMAVTCYSNSLSSNKYRQLPTLAALNEDWNPADINDYLIPFGHETGIGGDLKKDTAISQYLPELEGHLVSGSIKDLKSGEPFRNQNISLSIVGKVALCIFTKTDNSGFFNFVTREQGPGEIVIQPVSSEIRDCYVELHNPFSDYSNYEHGLFSLDTVNLGEINKAIISTQINNSYESYDPHVTHPMSGPVRQNFYGITDNTIQMSKYIELTSVKEILKELIPGISTIGNKGRINFRLYSQYKLPGPVKDFLVLVDGVPVYDYEKVLKITAKEIEKVDIINERYFISDNVFDGILHFVTKRGNLDVIEMDKSVFRQEYDFVQPKNEFYSPDHSQDSLKDSHLPDFRNTLYWNPDLHTDKSGRASVEFYSSDESSEYIINVEGFAGDGKTGTARRQLIIKSIPVNHLKDILPDIPKAIGY